MADGLWGVNGHIFSWYVTLLICISLDWRANGKVFVNGRLFRGYVLCSFVHRYIRELIV